MDDNELYYNDFESDFSYLNDSPYFNGERNSNFDSDDITDDDDSEIDDDFIDDIDFSDFRGNFKSGLSRINRRLSQRKQRKPSRRKRPIIKPLDKTIPVQKRATIMGGKKQLSKVIVPRDRKVIVEGVDQFILSDQYDGERKIGYYKGKKLQELVFNFNNSDSAIDFTIPLFDPSFPMNYFIATSQDVNDKVLVSGNSGVSYTDVLFNMLANPILIPNARIDIAGTQLDKQSNQSLIFTNKNIQAQVSVFPYNLGQDIDPYQFQSDVSTFDIMSAINRPYIPDGMDIANYTVFAGNTVTFTFYFKQIQLKRFFFKEARTKRLL